MGLIKNLMGLFIGFNLAQRVTSVFDVCVMARFNGYSKNMFFESIGLCCKWPFYPQYVPNRFYSVNQTQPLQFCLG